MAFCQRDALRRKVVPAISEPSPAADADPAAPNIARMYDYFLGGKDNYAVDREAAAKVLEYAPEVPLVAREGRRFLRRVVRFLAASGIRQFIDVGTGLPTGGHVHEVLGEFAPDATVAYVDTDPIVIAHAWALLKGNGRTTVVQADLREPETILSDPLLTGLIDLDRPVAILLLSVLHFIDDDAEALRVVARFREGIAPGSYLAFCHAVSDLCPETMAKLGDIYREGPMKGAKNKDQRTTAEVTRFLDGLEPIAPGVTAVPSWRPDPHETPGRAEGIWLVGGVGRRP
jgi:hypothetical protein